MAVTRVGLTGPMTAYGVFTAKEASVLVVVGAFIGVNQDAAPGASGTLSGAASSGTAGTIGIEAGPTPGVIGS
jgi:hypothetical protein